MSERHAAYDLVRAVDQYEALAQFDIGDSKPKVRLEWDIGAACAGYKELSAAMAKIVAERWKEIRDEVMARADAEVRRARQEMAAEMRKKGEH